MVFYLFGVKMLIYLINIVRVKRNTVNHDEGEAVNEFLVKVTGRMNKQKAVKKMLKWNSVVLQ